MSNAIFMVGYCPRERVHPTRSKEQIMVSQLNLIQYLSFFFFS